MTYADKNTVEIAETPGGAAIRFPYEYKDIFRQQFPTARWNSEEKQWQVGAKSVARLKEFAELMSKNMSMRIDREQREMTAEETEKLGKKLAEVDAQISDERNAVADLDAARIAIEEMKRKLTEKELELAEVRKQRAAAAAAVEAERADIVALVSSVVDVDEIEHCRSVMRQHMRILKAWASAKYDEATARLRELSDQLEAAGIESPAIHAALNANRNRPDRDFDDLLKPLDFIAL